VLNPLIFEAGTRRIAQGVAQALVEEFAYDPDGNPITGNLADYTFISAAELPTSKWCTRRRPLPTNPLGAKGVGSRGPSARPPRCSRP